MSGSLTLRLLALGLCAVLAACGPPPATLQQTTDQIAARIDAGDLAAADEMLRSAIVRWPDDPQLRQLQGDLDLERGYGIRAQAAYERALIRAPTNRVLKVRLARALMVQQRYREALAVAQPDPGDSAEIRARFALVRLETTLAMGSADPQAAREEAEDLWRLASSPEGSGMRDLRRRLAEAAAKWEPVKAARDHTQCRPSEEPARTAESDVATGELLRVGPAERMKTPAAAAAAAKDGAVIEIEDATYEGETVIWAQDNLTLRGRNGRPELRLGPASTGEPIWVLRGKRTVVENVAFTGTGAAGVGLRLEGADLTVRGSVFSGNGTAIAVIGADPGNEVLITGSEFGAAERGADRLDIGAIGKLTLEFSYLHGAPSAPAVSSRARQTRIDYNRIIPAPGAAGARAQRLLELPEGGRVEIVGNEFDDGGGVLPFTFISYGAPGGKAVPGSALYVLSNTFRNRTPGAAGVSARLDASVLIANNVFAGGPMSRFTGRAEEAGNQSLDSIGATFQLTRDSPAVDAAVDPLKLDAAAPLVEFEYRHSAAGVARVDVWKPDAGAHEFCDGGLAPLAPEPGLALPE